MATANILVDGIPQQVQVPDGLSKGGVQDWLMQQGATPEMVGLPPNQAAETGGFFNEMMIGTGETLTDLMGENLRDLFGLENDIRAPDSFAADLGRAVPAVGAAVALPFAAPALAAGLPAVAAQAGVAGLFGAAREKAKAERTGQDFSLGAVGVDAALAGATQGAAGLIGRFLSGRSALAQASKSNQALGLPADTSNLGRSTAQTIRGSGGLAAADDVNRNAMNFDTARALGFSDEVAATIDEFDETVFGQARRAIEATYDAAAPTGPVDVSGLKPILADLAERGLPDGDLTSIIKMIGKRTSIEANEWQGIQRALRGVSTRTGRNPVFGGLKSTVDEGVTALDEAAAAAGGDKALLRDANTRFKLLSTLEEIPAVVDTGQIPATQLLRKLSRENFKGIGSRAVAETGKVADPSLRRLVQTAKTVARFTRETAGGSATAGRQFRFGPASKLVRTAVGAAAGGSAVGIPGAAAGAAGALAAPGAIGRGLFATGEGVAGRFAGPAAAQIAPQLVEDESEETR